MSFIEKAKKQAAEAAVMAKGAAEKAATKIEQGGYVDKVTGTIDNKTGQKYTKKIDKVGGAAKSAVSKLAQGDPK